MIMTNELKALLEKIETALAKYSRVNLAEADDIRDDLLDIYILASAFIEKEAIPCG